MRLYYEIGLRSLRRATMYRTAYIMGMITNAFFGAVRCFVYIALYSSGSGTSVAGFTLEDAISYTWITQALISIGAGWITTDLADTIRSGDVVTDLSRPWSFYGYWFSRTLGERIFNLLLRGLLTYGIGVILFGARIPTAPDLIGFAATIALALPIIFAYTFIANLSAFWLLDIAGVWLISSTLMSFFGGFLIPLDFMPDGVAAVARALPFQAMSGLPAQVFLGQISGNALITTLLLQAGWIVVLTVCALLLQRVAMHKVVVQGG